MSKPKLEVKNLTRIFKNGKDDFVAVDNISFSIESKSILSILGPNGAGKTTTVQMIAGYLAPTSGKILIDGVEYSQITAAARKQIGVVLGGELGFYGRATARDNLNFFANLADIRRGRKEEVRRVLEAVSLWNVADKKVGEFSRGMRQRLHIARALLGSPSILLLDEPTNGLDVEIAHEIRDLIKSLAAAGTAILLTSHTMSEIESLADSVLLMGAGKIYHSGSIASIIEMSKITHIDRPATLEESYLALAPQLRRE